MSFARQLRIRLLPLAALAAVTGSALLSGCAPAPVAKTSKGGEPSLVFPAPPDEPRFFFERMISNSSDVVPESEQSALKRALTGQGGSGEFLAKPYAIAAYRGRVFVTDSGERVVKVFDIPGKRYYKIGNTDDAPPLQQPLGIDVDDQGTVYVADATAKTVFVYDQEGKFQRKIAGPKFFDRLSSVTVDPKGDRLYVVDIGGVTSEQHRVRIFNAKTGDHLFDIGKRGSGPGEFNLPRDVAIGKNGQIYVVDGGNFRVQVFDREGKYLKFFGQVGKQLGNFARPKEIAIDKEGNIYVADAAFGNFQIFDSEGQLLMFIGERAERNGPGLYMLPSGIAVDEDGRIYFVDQWFRKIDVFRPARLKETEGFAAMRTTADAKAGTKQ